VTVVGLRIWNDLPTDVSSAESLSTFPQRLEVCLKSESRFPNISCTVTNLLQWTTNLYYLGQY